MSESPSGPSFPFAFSDFYPLPLKFTDREAYNQELSALGENPLAILAFNGSGGLAPFDWGARGATAGIGDRIHGSGNGAAGPVPPAWFERLSPPELNMRISDTREYVAELRSAAGAGKVFLYMDFGTQVYGNHLMPANSGPDRWGFWEFHAHWDDYEEEFKLGPRPDSPTNWLRHTFDPNNPQFPDLPGLEQFRFSYRPVVRGHQVAGSPQRHHLYRYSACVNTAGFAVWWRQVVQWIARCGFDGIFLDNSGFGACWNKECQSGYSDHIRTKYNGATGEDAIIPGTPAFRYFTDNLNGNVVSDPSFENWYQRPNTSQLLPHLWWTEPGAPNTVVPSLDSIHGHFACRFDLPTAASVDLKQVISLDAAASYVFSAWVSLRGASLEVLLDNTQIFITSVSGNWIEVKAPIVAAESRTYILTFRFRGPGSLLVDNVHVAPVSELGSSALFAGLASGLPNPLTNGVDKLRHHESAAYWAASGKARMQQLIADGQEINERFQLFTNGIHSSVAHYSMAEKSFVPEFDLTRSETRRDVAYFPGIYDNPQDIGPPLVTNIFGYKFLKASVTANPIVAQITPRPIPDVGIASTGHNPDSALLQLAEATAFGGGTGIDDMLPQHYPLYATPAKKSEIRKVAREFWDFVFRHKSTLSGLFTYADIGIVFDRNSLAYYAENEYARGSYNHILDLAQDLSGQGALIDVFTGNRLTAAEFGRVRSLVIHDAEALSDAMLGIIKQFMMRGGVVFASGFCGDRDERFAYRFGVPGGTWPPTGLPPDSSYGIRARQPPFTKTIGAGQLHYWPFPIDAGSIIDLVEQRTKGLRIRTITQASPGTHLRVNVQTRPERPNPNRRPTPFPPRPPKRRMLIYVVNYAVPVGQLRSGPPAALTGVEVQVKLPQGFTPTAATFFSPEFQTVTGPVTIDGHGNALVKFPDGKFRIYAIAELAN